MGKIELKPFDAAEFLQNEAEIAAYLDAIAEENDPALFAAALGDVARARGMTALARDTGLSRETLYRSLSGQSVPSSDTIFKVVAALGMRVSIRSASAASKRHVPIARKSRQLNREKRRIVAPKPSSVRA